MSERLLPFRGIEPPVHTDEPWENALFEAQTQAEVDHALLMKRNALHASAQPLELGEAAGHTFRGNQYTGGIGGMDVDKFVADHPRLPGEDVFVWQGRIVQGLPKQTQSDLIFKTRERYEPVDFITEGAHRWCDEHGLPEPAVIPISLTPCNLEEADDVARYFEKTPDQSNDPEVQQAYADFRQQSAEMYDYMTKPEAEGGLGIKVDFTTKVDPYDTAKAQAEDLRDNHHITLQSGLGGAHDATMTQQEYDEFRAVHDVFGHAAVGGGFDRHGEYQAWLMHAAMYDGPGQQAMSTEYHAVNSAMWSGDPGTPGTGKSILLPEKWSEPPWERALTASASAKEDQLIDALGLDAEWATKFSKAPWHTGKDGAVIAAVLPLELGDSDGHSFRGNQWTGGRGGDGTTSASSRSSKATTLPGTTHRQEEGLAPVWFGEGVTKKPTKKQLALMSMTVGGLVDRFGVAASIKIVSATEMAALTDGASGAIACAKDGTIYMLENTSATIDSPANMGGVDHGNLAQIGTTRWVMTHEYGHLYEAGYHAPPTSQSRPVSSEAMYRSALRAGGLSPYGKANANEAYAESFADFLLSPTPTPTSIAYGNAFGWRR